MDEVITVSEAEVDKSKWKLLKQTYIAETANIPDTIKQTFLIQSQNQPLKWRIMTHWHSQAALDQMRATEAVPTAVRIFKTVNVIPQLDIWNSEVHQNGTELR